jgi:DNA repair photolyase
MRRRQYIEITCKSAVNRVQGMPFNWSLNPYRGCVHACHYCYARATHAYFGLNADDDFESTIFVKTNFPEVLQRELGRPSLSGERISIGTATDPYQPIEGKYQLTRKSLEALLDYRQPASIVTKSTLVQRDLDLLVELSRVTDMIVFFTVTTVDPEIWKAVEPGTPPPLKRLEALRRLREAGVQGVVFMAPVLPGITDSQASIEAVASAAKEHGAVSFGAMPLRLGPLVKEHYLSFVGERYPSLVGKYQRSYGGQNAPEAWVRGLNERVDLALERCGFPRNSMSGRNEDRYPRAHRQVPNAHQVQQLLLMP